jgi:hypothetical protein
MATTLEDRIKAQEERLKELKTQHSRAACPYGSEPYGAARGNAPQILVGAIVLAKVDQGVIDKATFHSWLEGALTNADDRALFGLPTA